MAKIFIIILSVLSINASAQCDDFSQSFNGVDPLCHNYTDGSVSVVLTGGVEPFELEIRDDEGILLNPGGEAETGFSLGFGWYYSYVIDDEGCELYDSVYLTNPAPLVIETSSIVEPSDVGECDGSITIDEVSGDYEILSFIWSPDPDDISGVGANVFPDACPGTYDVVVGTLSDSFELGVGLSINIQHQELIEVFVQNMQDIVVIVPTLESDLYITIFDVTGKTLHSEEIIDTKTVISKPKSGMLIYSISSSNVLLKNGLISLIE